MPTGAIGAGQVAASECIGIAVSPLMLAQYPASLLSCSMALLAKAWQERTEQNPNLLSFLVKIIIWHWLLPDEKDPT